MTDDQVIEIRWHASEASYREISRVLHDEGAKVEVEQDDKVIVFVPVIVAGIGIIALARATLRFIREAKHHGLIIDARSTPLDIREEPGLPYGTVVVIDSEGQRTERTDLDEDSLAELIKMVTS